MNRRKFLTGCAAGATLLLPGQLAAMSRDQRALLYGTPPLTGGVNLSGVLPMDAVSGVTWTVSGGIAALTKTWTAPGKPLFDLVSGGTIKTVRGGYPDVRRLALLLGINPLTGIGGAKISKFYDQSGNGRDPAQATSANQPYVWLILGNVYLAFGGILTQARIGASSMQYMTIPSGSFNNRSQTGFAIVKPYSTSNGTSSSTDNFSTIFTSGTTQNGLAAILANDFFNPNPQATLMDTSDFSGASLDPANFTIGKSVVSWQGTASARLISINEVNNTGGTPSANTMTGGLIGAFPSSIGVGLAAFSGRMIGVMVSSDILSAPNMATIRSACYSYANIRGTVPTTVPANVVIDGASYNENQGSDPAGAYGVTNGGGYGWAEMVQDGLSGQNIQWHNVAMSGSSWVTNNTNFARFTGPCYNSGASKNILVTGDSYGNEGAVTGAQMYADFATWLATAKGDAWDSIIVYILSSSDSAVQAYNALMIANAGANGITLVDMSGDARTDNTLAPNAYFGSDGHPTVLGSQVFASYLQPAIQAAL